MFIASLKVLRRSQVLQDCVRREACVSEWGEGTGTRRQVPRRPVTSRRLWKDLLGAPTPSALLRVAFVGSSQCAMAFASQGVHLGHTVRNASTAVTQHTAAAPHRPHAEAAKAMRSRPRKHTADSEDKRSVDKCHPTRPSS